MFLARVLGACVVLISVSEAFIEFEKSRIYDEKDFQDQNKATLNTFCSAGCNIYVSIPEGSRDIARNIVIDTGSKTTSLNDANSKDKDGHKTPYAYKGGEGVLKFTNKNNGLAAAPLLIYIVQFDAPYINDVEIYDAADLNRKAASAGLITVMSTEPFFISTTTKGLMTVSAYTAGFDAFDSADVCTRVLRQEDVDTYQDVVISVRSPLITFFYDKSIDAKTTVAMVASTADVPSFDLAKPMFVTSPGYIGCAVKDGVAAPDTGARRQVFSSSLYNEETEFVFTSDSPVAIQLSGDATNDALHAVEIVADQTPAILWSTLVAGKTIALEAKRLAFSWARNDADLNQYFMIRVERDQGLHPVDATTAAPEPEHEKTTTAAPEQEKTTTGAPEPEPEKTTTAAPEPEPEKTTTGAPEPEPEKTTTAAPEPEPEITTAAPEPEPEITTAAPEPEPEITTAAPEPGPEFTTAAPEPEPEFTTAAPEPEPEITTAAPEPEPEFTTAALVPEPETTTAAPEPEPEFTTTGAPEPEKTTTPKTMKTTTVELAKMTTTMQATTQTRRTMPTTTSFHPKSTVTSTIITSTSTLPPTTSGAGYGSSLLLSVVVSAAVFVS